MSISEAICVGETIELQIEHVLKPNRQQLALVTLYRQVKKDLAEKSRP